MNYEEFVADYTAKMQEQLGRDVELIRQEFTKVNQKLDGINVRYPDTVVSPTIYLKDKYELYDSGYSMEQVVAESIDQVNRAYMNAPDITMLREGDIKKHLYCSVMNISENKELLNTVPYEKIEDLAVVARYRVGDDASILVTNVFCEHAKITSEELFEYAHRNTDRDTFRCENMAYSLKRLLQDENVSDDYIDEMIEMEARNCPIYVLSNEQMIDGASALASNKVMTEAYNQVKTEYPEMENMVVIGSSRHELLLIPDTFVDSIEDLKMMHQSVQNQDVKDEDKLSQNIYLYDAETMQLSIANTEPLSISESFAEEVTFSHARSH